MKKQNIKIIIGSDHAGFKLKENIKKYLKNQKIDFEDLGTDSLKPVDYPVYAVRVAEKVLGNKNNKGILICGTGTGMVMAANRIKGIRAVAAYDIYSAKMSRNDNNANILGLRGRYFPFEKVKKILSVWLKTPFSDEKRHKKRINRIDKIKFK